jgi:hypothetical protein
MSDFSDTASESTRPDPGDTQSLFELPPSNGPQRVSNNDDSRRQSRSRKRTTGTADLENKAPRVLLYIYHFIKLYINIYQRSPS